MHISKTAFAFDRVTSEYLRGIAIVFVVLGHILGGQFGIFGAHITAILGTGGVSIFLLLSGYGLYQSYRKNGMETKSYWNKKLEKIFVPYAVVTIVYYLYLMLCGITPGFAKLFENILCIDYARTMDGTMWYMSFLLLWYIAFFLVFLFQGSLIGKVVMLFLLGCAFRTGWLEATFGKCAWQFSENAFSFPIGVGFGYLMDLFNHARLTEKRKAVLCAFIRVAVFAGSLAVLVLGALKVFAISYWKCGLAMFFVLYGLLSLLKKGLCVFEVAGREFFPDLSD